MVGGGLWKSRGSINDTSTVVILAGTMKMENSRGVIGIAYKSRSV